MILLKTYSVSDTKDNELNEGKLHKDIVDSGAVDNFGSVTKTGNTFSLIGDAILDESALDALIANHEEDLTEHKAVRYVDIDERTSELIDCGFAYQGKVFSLSQNAQINLVGLDGVKDDVALSYPITYNTIDDLDSYNVEDSTDLHTMYLTALATKKAITDSGTVLKTSIRNATTKVEIDAIIDNR